MNKKNNRKGFTIVELVIVIAVIAILATVLVPTFSGIVADAKESALLQEAKNLYTQYVADNASSDTYSEDIIVEIDSKYYLVQAGVPSVGTAYDSAENAAKAMGVVAGGSYVVYNGTTATDATVPTTAS